MILRPMALALALACALAPAIAGAQTAYRYVEPGQVLDGRFHDLSAELAEDRRPAETPHGAPDSAYATPPAPSLYAPGYDQGYYRDYYPAAQYGYTYGSAHGRGYGYSRADMPDGARHTGLGYRPGAD